MPKHLPYELGTQRWWQDRQNLCFVSTYKWKRQQTNSSMKKTPGCKRACIWGLYLFCPKAARVPGPIGSDQITLCSSFFCPFSEPTHSSVLRVVWRGLAWALVIKTPWCPLVCRIWVFCCAQSSGKVSVFARTGFCSPLHPVSAELFDLKCDSWKAV